MLTLPRMLSVAKALSNHSRLHGAVQVHEVLSILGFTTVMSLKTNDCY